MKPPTAAPSTPRDVLAPWMPIAHRFRGVRELVGQELNPVVRDFFRHTRFPMSMVNRKTSWCGAFCSACLALAGAPNPRTARARDFLLYGVPLARPVYGAILVFSRGTSEETGHVGFCDDYASGASQVLCYSGNQDNCCCTRPKSMRDLLGVRWPPGFPLPPDSEAPAVG